MTSWKTTLFGMMAIFGGGIIGAFELKPALLAGFPTWLPGLGFLLSTIGTGGIGLTARDNDKSSEDVGAAKPTAVPIRGIAVSLFLALGLAGVMVGCAGTPARIAFSTVAAPAATVDVAMAAWGDYVAQFHPPAATELKVKNAYELYQKTELVAIDAAQTYATLASSGSTNGLGEAQLYDMLSSQTSRNALNDLLNLLTSLGIKF
jgi:hypothetical protein